MFLNTIMGGAIFNSRQHIFMNLAFFSNKGYVEMMDQIKYGSVLLDSFPIIFDNCSRFFKLVQRFKLEKNSPQEKNMRH
jgi:hypothetical protein